MFLFPFSKANQDQPLRQNNIVKVKTTPSQATSEVTSEDTIESVVTTAEEIRTQLALSEKEKPEVVMVNFSTNHLLPGSSLLPSKRKAGKSLDAFRETAKSLYKSEA